MKKLIAIITLLIMYWLFQGCNLTLKINKHYSFGEQVFVQKHDKCGRPDRFGEVVEVYRNKQTKKIEYKVKQEWGQEWKMTYSQEFLDSLNHY